MSNNRKENPEKALAHKRFGKVARQASERTSRTQGRRQAPDVGPVEWNREAGGPSGKESSGCQPLVALSALRLKARQRTEE